MAKARDYRQEYKDHQSSTKSKKDRASRNKVRRASNKSGRTSEGDGKDIDHVNGNPRDNRKGNTRVVSKSVNRAKH